MPLLFICLSHDHSLCAHLSVLLVTLLIDPVLYIQIFPYPNPYHFCLFFPLLLLFDISIYKNLSLISYLFFIARTDHSNLCLSSGTILVMGGDIGSAKLNDVWRSTDSGANWSLLTSKAAWPGKRKLTLLHSLNLQGRTM